MLIGDVETRDALVRAAVEPVDEHVVFAELLQRRADRRRRRATRMVALAVSVVAIVGAVLSAWPNSSTSTTLLDSSKTEVPRFLPGFLPDGVELRRYSGSVTAGHPVAWHALFVRAGTNGPVDLEVTVYPVPDDRLPGSDNDDAIDINGRPGVVLGSVRPATVAWSIAPGLQGWVSGDDQSRDLLVSVASSVELRDPGPAFDVVAPDGFEMRWQGVEPRLGDGKYLLDYARLPSAEKTASVGVGISQMTASEEVLPLEALLALKGSRPLTVRGKPAVAIGQDLRYSEWVWEERPGLWVTLDFSGGVDDVLAMEVAESLREVDATTFNRAISAVPRSSPATSTIPG